MKTTYTLTFLGLFAAILALPAASQHEEAISKENRGYFLVRSGLDNARIAFESGRARVVFLGGSITHMKGWRAMISTVLQNRFPNTAFDFVDAGIPSTGSTMGAARLHRDVFSRGSVDLLFVEFAVNDSTNHRTPAEMVRGMEGIIAQARATDSTLDIVMMHFVDDDKIAAYNAGKIPEVIQNHERVAEYYGVPSINLAREVAERIAAGEFDWEKFGGIHPAPFGHEIYRATINNLFDAAWANPLPENAAKRNHIFPKKPLDAKSYYRARLVDPAKANIGDGWKLDPAWHPEDKAGTREGYVDVPMLVSNTPGAEVTLEFKGTAMGMIVAAGPDVGMVEYGIDDEKCGVLDQFTEWSHYLHIPWAYTLDGELEPGPHVLWLRVSDRKNPESNGYGVRIKSFYAN
ncbi:MAG: SGNH/GDSL hydrolase family protein [Candidatus Hydrogenedentota bacterium]